MKLEIDAIDRKILGLLQRDSSLSTIDIAHQVGISQAPCWRRIQKLKESGIVRKQVALLDRKELGLKTQILAQVKLTATGRANLQAFTDAIQDFPEVLECFVLMGSVDFMLKIVAQDIEAYERFFFDKLSQVPGVQEINSMVALAEIKATTELPL